MTSTSVPGETGSKYRRVVLKLSGESFSAAGERGISMNEVLDIARQVYKARQIGCELALVIGGGDGGRRFEQREGVLLRVGRWVGPCRAHELRAEKCDGENHQGDASGFLHDAGCPPATLPMRCVMRDLA